MLVYCTGMKLDATNTKKTCLALQALNYYMEKDIFEEWTKIDDFTNVMNSSIQLWE